MTIQGYKVQCQGAEQFVKYISQWNMKNARRHIIHIPNVELLSKSTIIRSYNNIKIVITDRINYKAKDDSTLLNGILLVILVAVTKHCYQAKEQWWTCDPEVTHSIGQLLVEIRKRGEESSAIDLRKRSVRLKSIWNYEIFSWYHHCLNLEESKDAHLDMNTYNELKLYMWCIIYHIVGINMKYCIILSTNILK